MGRRPGGGWCTVGGSPTPQGGGRQPALAASRSVIVGSRTQGLPSHRTCEWVLPARARQALVRQQLTPQEAIRLAMHVELPHIQLCGFWQSDAHARRPCSAQTATQGGCHQAAPRAGMPRWRRTALHIFVPGLASVTSSRTKGGFLDPTCNGIASRTLPAGKCSHMPGIACRGRLH